MLQQHIVLVVKYYIKYGHSVHVCVQVVFSKAVTHTNFPPASRCCVNPPATRDHVRYSNTLHTTASWEFSNTVWYTSAFRGLLSSDHRSPRRQAVAMRELTDSQAQLGDHLNMHRAVDHRHLNILPIRLHKGGMWSYVDVIREKRYSINLARKTSKSCPRCCCLPFAM